MTFARAKRASALLLAILLAGCDGGGTTDPPDAPSVIAVGIARLDDSPEQPLTGYLAFFYDPTARRLLVADARINAQPLTTTILPGIVAGPVYLRGADVRPDQAYRLVATIQTSEGPLEVTSQQVVTPSEFQVRAPAEHPRGQPLRVEWDPVANAEGINVILTGTTFEAILSGNATEVTIPGGALTVPGLAEIEVTAFNGFYVSLSTGISTLADAEEAARRFSEAENITGARGSFGAATTIGVHVEIQ